MTTKKKLTRRRLTKSHKSKPIDDSIVAANNLILSKSSRIVGIGASAGGLEAISELLTHLPSNTGMAFVFVSHLDPAHISKIDEILARKTSMPVVEIKNNMRVQADHVYVIPPNSSLKIVNGVFKISPRLKSKGIHLTIDTFFISLANDQQSKCMGIILSGTASDGTHGLAAIKAAGGLTIAQNPKSAKYDNMPRNAIVAGVVDSILTPKQIGEELARIAQHPLIIRKESDNIGSSRELAKHEIEDCFSEIITLLQNKCHVDFSHYKRSTLNRRIARQMVLARKKHLKEYLEYLETNPDEIESLFEDLLINVTEFFRDTKAFANLKTQIFPEIMKKRAGNSTPIRIWVVGCATGEEAYSVTMSLLEYIDEHISVKQPIQIFATDISEQAIQKARVGVYPESIHKHVSKERLQRFFVKTETGYRVKNFIREICLFSWHDVTADPPYAKLDLICCRNLLIYFDQTLQEHVLPIFHYALKPNGFLWLGISENVGKLLPALFDLIDKTNKFYLRKPISFVPKFHFPSSVYVPEKLEITKKLSVREYGSTDILREIDRIAALKYSPPGVVVNSAMEIILIRGEIAPYMQLSHGQASFNLFKLAKAEVAFDLRSIMRIAKKKNAPIREDGHTVRFGNQLKTFSIDVVPFTLTMASDIKERYFLISFELATGTVIENLHLSPQAYSSDKKLLALKKSDQKRVNSKDRYIQELEQEQSDAKMYQKSLIKDFEITQEELTSTNEELQSTIEELQSTNEELETAKEELQSTNEELTTVNDELQIRNVDLTKLYDDLVNLLECVDIPIVMVSLDKNIRRFTPKASEMMNLIQSDVGRPISDINPNFNVANLGTLVSQVIKTHKIKETNVQDRKGRWFRLQIRPYKTIENKIDGAVIALVDINLLKTNLIETTASLDYANSVANTVYLPLVVLDKRLRLVSANHAFYKKFQVTEQIEETDLLTLISAKKKTVSQVRKMLTNAFIENVVLEDFEIEYEFDDAQQGILLLNGQRIQWIGDEPNALLLCIQDITDRVNIKKSLDQAIIEAKRAANSKDKFLATLSHELRTPLTAILCWTQLLLKMAENGSKKVSSDAKALDPSKLKHALQAIEQNSKIQGQLIDDLLDVSRIQSGKLVLNISPLDPGDVVHTAVESVRPLALSKSITIKTRIKPLNGEVSADPARLQQIVWNILTNAIKFSYAKQVIDVCVNSIKKQGKQFAVIKVIDRGQGIKPDFLPQLFERFTQADSTSTRLHGGLGLGLTIANDLLKLLGGSISAESAGVGKGATFTVLLPLIAHTKKLTMKNKKKIKKMKTHVEKITGKTEATILSQKLQGLSILVVEDDQSSLDVITELLNFAGAKTITATSLAEAMIALDRDQPDILISDIAMPGEDGLSLILKIRERGTERCGQIPAVALSAYAAKEDITRAHLAGFNAHLAKPFNAADLILCIANLATQPLRRKS